MVLRSATVDSRQFHDVGSVGTSVMSRLQTRVIPVPSEEKCIPNFVCESTRVLHQALNRTTSADIAEYC